MARSLVASDNFNRADSGSLGANWTDLFPSWATADIATNRVVAADVAAPQVSRWNGAGSFSNDQYAKITVSTRVWESSGFRTGVIVRASADTDTARDYYYLHFYHDQDVGTAVTTVLGKCVNGTETTLVSDSISWGTSDTVELEVTTVAGNAQLRCFKNGSALTSLNHTDSSTPLTTGKPGIYLQGNSSIAAEDWEGGDVTSGSESALTGSAGTLAQGSASVSPSKAATGEAVTSAAGTIVQAITVALVGIAISLSSGSVGTNTDGNVPVSGSEVTTSTGTTSPSYSRALTGEEITSAQTAPAVNRTPTQISGQVVTSASGTIIASGDGLTVHISGVEATFATGVIDSGVHAISGQATTSAQGSCGLNLSLPLTGSAFSCEIGNIAAAQEADDTFIQSSSGTVVSSLSLTLAGSEVSTAQGAFTVTGDGFADLVGEEITSETGTVSFSQSFELSGVQINSAQETVGAPGGAALSGVEITSSPGSVFTTADREFALTGVETTVQAGDTFASPLAFVDGLEIVTDLQGIGPREVTLSGAEITSSAGSVEVARVIPTTHAGGVKPSKKKRNYIIRGRRYYGLSDEELRLLLLQDEITREDIQVVFKGKKPHPVSKAAFEDLKSKNRDTLEETDEEEAFLLL
jgi:hypothetical protein